MGMFNSLPFEVVYGPAEVWEAPVSTAYPKVDAAPAVAWVKLGTDGSRNITSDGISLKLSETVEKFRPLGGTGVKKFWRTEEDLNISLVLADLTLEHLGRVINYNTVSDNAAAVIIDPTLAPTKTVGLSRGPGVSQRALLVRIPSPYMDDGIMQLEIPIVSQIGSPDTKFAKSTPAGLMFEWTAVEDPNATSEDERYGRAVAQTAVAAT